MESQQQLYGIRALANWILDYADSQELQITNMALNKLIYFSYEFALINHNRKLTGAKIEAWEHGPVFREVYRSFKHHGDKFIDDRASIFSPSKNTVEIVKPELDSADQKIVSSAIEHLANLPASILREISHADGGAWSRVWYHDDKTNPGMQITDEIILTSSPKVRTTQ